MILGEANRDGWLETDRSPSNSDPSGGSGRETREIMADFLLDPETQAEPGAFIGA